MICPPFQKIPPKNFRPCYLIGRCLLAFFINPWVNMTTADHQEPHPHPNPPPEGKGILWGFLTFMEVFPIPLLSRGRSGGGWGIYVAVVLIRRGNYLRPKLSDFFFRRTGEKYLLGDRYLL